MLGGDYTVRDMIGRGVNMPSTVLRAYQNPTPAIFAALWTIAPTNSQEKNRETL
jgi:hypothetical protein